MSTTLMVQKRGQEKRKLPDGWRWVKLEEVCDLNPSRPWIDRQDSDPTSFVPMESVDATSGMITNLRTRSYGEVKKGYTFFSDGDILFAKITPCMQNGKHSIAKNLIGGIGFGTTEFHVVKPKEHVISEWIWFYLRQPYVLSKAVEHFTGAVGQQRLPEGYLSNIEIPLPPLEEQKRIAELLKKQMVAVEKARAAAQARLEAAKALPAAFLREVFPQSGQLLPNKWRWVKLGEICALNPSRLWIDRKDSDLTSFVPMESVDATSGSIVDLRVRPYGEVKKGYTFFINDDVLFAKITPCMQNGKHSIARNLIDGIGFGTTEFHVLRPGEHVMSEWIWFYLRQPYVLSKAVEHFTGAVGQQRLPEGYLANIEIPLPPLEEQKRIAHILKRQMTAVEKTCKATEEELNAINALPAALLRRAFNGEL